MPPDLPPPLPRSPRKKVLWVIAGLVLFYLGLPAGIYLWGVIEWKMLERELRAKGEKLTFQEAGPSTEVPDAEDFFSDSAWDELKDLIPDPQKPGLTPRLKEGERQFDRLGPQLTLAEFERLKAKFPGMAWPEHLEKREAVALHVWSYQSEKASAEEKRQLAACVMELLAPAEPFLQKLKALAIRSHSDLPVKYEDGFLTPLPQIPYILAGAQMLGVRAKAEIVLGQQDQAFDDIQLTFRLEHFLKDAPILIPLLTRCYLSDRGVSAVAIGLNSHVWNPTQLRDLLDTLSGVDLVADLPRVLRGERMSFNATIAKMRKKGNIYNDLSSVMTLAPSEMPVANRWSLGGMFYLFSFHDQTTFNRFMQGFIDEVEAIPRQGIPERPSVKMKLKSLQDTGSGKVSCLLTLLSLPPLLGSDVRVAEVQDRVEMARVACALELYWLKNARYPENTAELTPEFLSFLPSDVVDRNPLKYKLKSPEEYLLYSIGSDRRDDGGRPADKENRGDWVWGISKKVAKSGVLQNK